MPNLLSLTPPGSHQVTHDPTVRLSGDPMSLMGDNPFLEMTEAIIFGAVNTLLGWIDDATGLDLLEFALLIEGLIGSENGLLSGLFNFLTPGGLTEGGGVFGPLLSLIPGLGGTSSLLDFSQWLNPATLLAGGGIFAPLLSLIPGLGNLGDFGEWLSPATLLTGGGIFAPILDQLPGIDNLGDFGDFLNNIPGISTFLDWFGLDPGGDESTLQAWATGILTGSSPLDAANIFNFGNLWGKIPIGNLTAESVELLDNPDFREAISLQGGGVIVWDGTVGRTVLGSAKFTANGLQNVLVSNTIAVGQNDKVHPAIFAKWTGLTYTGTKPVKLEVVRLLYDSVTQTFATMGTDEIAAPTNPVGTQGAWFLLSGDYTVPANTSHIALRLVVEGNASAGNVWFDDASCMKTGLIEMPWVAGLPEELQSILGFAQSILNHIFGGLFGALPDADVGLMDIFDGLSAIPPANVLGLQGGSIVDTFQGTIDTLWGGFAQIFGSTGKSIFDVASLTSDTVSIAHTGLEVGEWNNAILGNRTSESLFTGSDPTEISNFGEDQLANGAADPVTLNAAAGFTPMAFYRAPKSDTRSVIHWKGKGFANITSLFIDVYRFNYGTSQLEWVHTSSNVIAMVGAAWSELKYVMPTGITLNMGDTIAIGWRVVGTGTHSIAGLSFGAWKANDTYVPYKQGGIRTDSAATTISFSTLAGYYSGNVPWVGLGIDTGNIIPDYHAPRTTQFTTPGAYSYTPPDWADEVLEFLCGSGGGGQGGDPAIFQTGQGGKKGTWSVRKLVKGTDFATGQTLTGTVAAGGPHGNWPAQDGENGSPTVRNAISGGNGSHSAAGGLGGRSMGSPKSGEAAGTSPTLDGFSFAGGGPASNGKPGANGQSPGGGGGGGDGGTWGVAWEGGNGARGVAIYVAKQVD